jgi:hypothetical protein
VAVVQFRVIGVVRTVVLDGAEDGLLVLPAMYCAVSRWAWAASAVTTALSRFTLSRSSLT